MIKAWIIEELRRRQEQQQDNRPVLQLPLYDVECEQKSTAQKKQSRVITISMYSDDEEEEES